MVKEIGEGKRNRKFTISKKLEIVKYAKETNNHQADYSPVTITQLDCSKKGMIIYEK